MRVLHLGSGNMFGGIETLLVTLARERHRCPDMDPHFALAFEGRLSAELTDVGIPVHLLGRVRTSRPHTVIRARQLLAELLERLPFDVAVSHGPWVHAIFGPAVRKARVPLVFWAHNPVPGKHWVERWASRVRPSLVVCNSEFTSKHVPGTFPATRRAVVHYPVAPPVNAWDECCRERVREHHGVPPGTSVVVQVSRLESWKGHETLVEAFGLLRERPDWVGWVVGYPQRKEEEEYARRLKTLATRLGVADRVQFLQTTGRVEPLFKAADVFCQPNVEPEPFGIVFVEAMLQGLPVITSDMGGPREFVDDSCGVRVPARNSQAVADALVSLFDDKARRARMGEEGARRAREKFDPTRQLGRLWDALSRVAPQVQVSTAVNQ